MNDDGVLALRDERDPVPDDQTLRIVEYMAKSYPPAVFETRWMSHLFLRLADALLLGVIGRWLVARAQRVPRPEAMRLLSWAIAVCSSKRTMAKALFYRANYRLDGAATADAAVADYSLAIYYDPLDGWSRKDRATIYQMYGRSYRNGDRFFALPMTHTGACRDAEAAIAHFRELAGRSSKAAAAMAPMLRQSEETLEALKATVPALEMTMGPHLRPLEPGGDHRYHIFLSYKSEDVAVARTLAELLRSSGLNVWFAEYNVGLDDRAAFEARIRSAAKQCRYGICLTNDLYAGSPWCRLELQMLLEHVGVDRIVEIALPRQATVHEEFPALSGARCRLEVSPWILAEEGDPSAPRTRSVMLPRETTNIILQTLAEATGLPISGCEYLPVDPRSRRRFKSHGVAFSLDLSGWTERKPGALERLFMGRDSPVTAYSMDCPAGRFWGHLVVGSQDIRSNRARIGEKDDRAYYEAALDFARAFYGKTFKQQCVGVHLLFLNGLSHAAFTTHGSGGSTLMGSPSWSRLYSVVLEAGREADVEFAFFFFFRGDLAGFLHSAHLMDRVVLSLRRERALPWVLRIP